jgi:hypothetical protein
MSTALAVAGVTAVIRDLLESWLSDQDANTALGGANAAVTALPPDLIELTGSNAGPKLNLFLHQVSTNAGWRNVDRPSRDARGERISNPPLALDLHYLLTAYGAEELHTEILLGYGMQLLHEMPVVGREMIEDRLPVGLRSSQLGRQVEMIKISPENLNTEEISRLWSALQAKYRPTAPYQVSVVLIDATSAGQAAPPVLTRGPVDPATGDERGIVVLAELGSSLPGITAVQPPDNQPGAALGDTVTIEGHHLDGTNRSVRLENRVLGIERDVAALAGGASDEVRFNVPNTPAALAVGMYSLRVLVQRPGETQRRETNQLSLTIVPSISTTLPLTVARDAQGTATVALNSRPQVRPHQRTSLLVGGREVLAEDHPTQTAALTFVIEDAPVGTHLVRLRVGGIDSLIVDRSATPPMFLDRRLVIT